MNKPGKAVNESSSLLLIRTVRASEYKRRTSVKEEKFRCKRQDQYGRDQVRVQKSVDLRNIQFNLTYLAVTVLAYATTAPAKTQVN